MSKRKSPSRRSRRPLAGTGLQDIVDSGQQLISEAQDRASDAAKQVQKVASNAVSTLEKRRDVELKNLRGRLKDINTAVGGLERRYRTLEKRLTKQIETISGRAVKASDLDKRIRAVEAEIRKAAGLGRSAAGTARARATRTATKRKTTTAARKTTARRTTARKPVARKPAARKTTAKRVAGAARSTSRSVSAAAKAASTTVTTAARAASTGAAKGATSARRSAAGSAGGRAKAKSSTARKPAARKPAAKKPATKPSTGTSS